MKSAIILFIFLSAFSAEAKGKVNVYNIMRGAAKRYSIPERLLLSVCWVESRHKVNALNELDGDSPSYGLCQIKYETAKGLGFKGQAQELLDGKTNARFAAKYLSFQLKRYNGDEAKAIRAYNRGHFDGVLFSDYYKKVMVAMEMFE